MYNQVDESNFNETVKGYVIRALKIIDKTELTDKVLNGLRWAFDEMTMEDAREEYKSYSKIWERHDSMVLKVIPPNGVEKIDRQIKALKSIIPKDSLKDKAIHEKAVWELEKHREKLLRGN